MKPLLSTLCIAAAIAVAPIPSSAQNGAAKIYFDLAHGQETPPEALDPTGKKLKFEIIPSKQDQPITADGLKGFRLLYLRAPSTAFAGGEKKAVIEFLKAGGALFLVLDEERRQQLMKTGVNDLIEPFDLKLTPDTKYVHNCGAIAKKGDIHAADREIPFSGGRSVEGGTPFAWQLDKDGKPDKPCAAYKKLDGGGRIVVMGEGMASLFLGNPQGERLGEPRGVYWGKDSAIFNEEVLAWLVARSASDEPKPENKLVGTWKEVSAKYDGKEARPPEGFTFIKHVTPTQFMWVGLDKDGNVIGAFGGPYTLTGDKYEETFEYGIGNLFKSLKGKSQPFTWKVEGNKWYHNGKTNNGATLEEVWERVEKK